MIKLINTKYSTLAKFMKFFLLPAEMVLKTENWKAFIY